MRKVIFNIYSLIATFLSRPNFSRSIIRFIMISWRSRTATSLGVRRTRYYTKRASETDIFETNIFLFNNSLIFATLVQCLELYIKLTMMIKICALYKNQAGTIYPHIFLQLSISRQGWKKYCSHTYSILYPWRAYNSSIRLSTLHKSLCIRNITQRHQFSNLRFDSSSF